MNSVANAIRISTEAIWFSRSVRNSPRSARVRTSQVASGNAVSSASR